MKAFFLILTTLLLLSQCSPDKITGTGTDTGNAKGRLVRSDGTPASGVTVYFYSVDNNPRQSLAKSRQTNMPAKVFAVAGSTVTDDSGDFSDSLADGLYNMLAGDDSTAAFEDSVLVEGDTVTIPVDTLKVPGSLTGTIQLQPGHDPRTTFIIALGTNTFTTPGDTTGVFTLSNMAEGQYTVRILSTLDDYSVLDTTFSISSGATDTLSEAIQLPFTGIPVVTGLSLAYDTLKQIVSLSWDKADTSLVKGYNVYRKHSDSDFVKINSALISDTMYSDSTGMQDATYEYKIAAVNSGDTEGEKSGGSSVAVVSAYTAIDTIIQLSGMLGNFVVDRNGDYFVINHTTNKIEVFDNDGLVKRNWDIPGGLMQSDQWAKKITMGDSAYLYLANRNTKYIQKFDTLGNMVDSLKFSTGILQNRVSCVGLAFYKDTLFFADGDNRNIYAVNRNGDLLFTLNHNWDVNDFIWSMDADTAGNIYVYGEFGESVPTRQEKIEVFDKKGKFLYDIIADYGSGNISISQDKILLLTKTNVFCFNLVGALVFKFTPGRPSATPHRGTLGRAGEVLIGFENGRIQKFLR